MNAVSRRCMLPAALWLAVGAAAVSVASLGLLSTERHPSPVEIGNSSVALIVAQAFFLVFLWPLFEREATRAPNRAGLGDAAIRLLALILLGVPLLLLTLRTAEMDTGAILRGQLFLLVLGIAVAALVRLPAAVLWYYPAAFLISAAVPFAAYLLREEGDVAASWAASISPLWAAGRIVSGAANWAPLTLFALLAAASSAALLVRRRGNTNHA